MVGSSGYVSVPGEVLRLPSSQAESPVCRQFLDALGASIVKVSDRGGGVQCSTVGQFSLYCGRSTARALGPDSKSDW